MYVEGETRKQREAARAKGKGKGRRQRANGGKRQHEIYMDDRNWTNDNAEDLMQGVRIWEEWSEKVGLKDNALKRQVGAKTALGKRQLTREATKWGMEQAVKQTVEILGTTTVGAADRKISEKEKSRIEEGRKVFHLVKVFPLAKCMGG